MLKFIEGSRASLFPVEMDAMFRNRAITFSERLGWDVTVKDGYERDEFDNANPLYLVSVYPNTNEYWGSLRLLPTTGPNMLRDVFPASSGREKSSKARQSGRAPGFAPSPQMASLSAAGTGQLRAQRVDRGIGEIAVIAGLTQIVSVFDARIYRVLKAVGCNPQFIGRPRRIGGTMSYAGLFDTGEGLCRL